MFVCVCVSPVTALVSEVLNHDRNSGHLLMPAAPITREGNTMVSVATPTLASLSAPSTPGVNLRAHWLTHCTHHKPFGVVFIVFYKHVG